VYPDKVPEIDLPKPDLKLRRFLWGL